MADFPLAGSYSYNAVGSNTLVQVTASPTVLYDLHIHQNGGSMGYLQIYNGGTGDPSGGTITAGTLMDWVVAVPSGTSGAGTPTVRDIVYGPFGRAMNGGLSYMWAAGSTGTVAHGVNCVIDITYRGTIS